MYRSIIRIFILQVIILAFNSGIYAQLKGKIFSRYYSPKEYGALTQNWAIAQDENGLMYFGNNLGLLIYDGTYWDKVIFPNNSTARAMAKTHEGKIIVGIVKDMGYIETDKRGKHYFHSVKHLINQENNDFSDVWSAQSTSKGDFYLTDNYLFRIRDNEAKTWKKRGKYFFLCFNVEDDLYVHEVGVGLQKIVRDSLVLVPNGDFFAEKRIYNIFKVGDKTFIFTRYNGIFIYEEESINALTSFNTSPQVKEINDFLKRNIIYSATKVNDSTIAASTIKNGALIFTDKGNILDIINEESTGLKSQILSMYSDAQGNLWMGLDNGILRSEIGTPFRLWDKDLGLDGTTQSINILDSSTYLATGSGVFRIDQDSTQNIFSIHKTIKYPGIIDQAWNIDLFYPSNQKQSFENQMPENALATHEYSPKDSCLLVTTTSNLFLIEDKKIVSLFDLNGANHTYTPSSNPNRIYVGLDKGIAQIDYEQGKWYYKDFITTASAKINSMLLDRNGDFWFAAEYKGVYKLDKRYMDSSYSLDSATNLFQLYDTARGLPSIIYNNFYNMNHQVKLLTPEGVYVYDSLSNNFKEDKSVGEKYVDSTWKNQIHIVSSKNIWINSFTDDYKKGNGRYYSDTCTYQRIQDYIISTISADYRGNMWIGTPDGFLYYNHKINKRSYPTFQALIRKVILYDDSLLFYGGMPKQANNPNSNSIDLETVIPHDKNSITFIYSAPYFIDESKNMYSCFLEGFDETWSPWSMETKKRYTNLREGKYVFKVKAKNIYQQESEISEFHFKILPPWHRTSWAFFIYLIASLLFIILIIKLYTQRLIKEKDKLENTVKERTQEILMQKEEILSQTENLKKANENILEKNAELEAQKAELEIQRDQLSKRTWQLRKLNNELIKLSKVASETDNAIAIFDKSGNMQWVNDGFTRMYGFTLSQFIEERDINLIKASENPNISEVIRRCLDEQKSVIYEYKAKTRSGKNVWVQTTLTNVIDKRGETINLIAIDSDITKIKEAEEEILRQKREIENQRDQLEKSDATKNKFFRIIAHDLRNPMSTLVSATSSILQLIDELDKDKTKDFVGELNKLSQSTFNLLENLLDWSSSQMKEIPYAPKQTDLQLIASENIELIQTKLESKNIKLISNVSEKTYVFADENMIKTVVRNLLSNAIKFTPVNGEIEISSTESGEFIKTSVKDSGVGIQKEDQSKLFRIDVHHSTLGTSNEKGSGLGLILCKEFIDKNGGEIWVQSVVGKGSIFTFTLKKMKPELNAFNI